MDNNEVNALIDAFVGYREMLVPIQSDFLQSSNRYTEEVNKLISTFESISGRISSVNELEAKAEEQIGKLDTILDEKRRSYNLKDLEKSLDQYNANLQNVSDFINKQVAENIIENTRSIQSVKDGNENIAKRLEEEKKSVDDLVGEYKSSNELLRKIVENQDVNEEYIFDIIDRWAESRKVKTKR